MESYEPFLRIFAKVDEVKWLVIAILVIAAIGTFNISCLLLSEWLQRRRRRRTLNHLAAYGDRIDQLIWRVREVTSSEGNRRGAREAVDKLLDELIAERHAIVYLAGGFGSEPKPTFETCGQCGHYRIRKR